MTIARRTPTPPAEDLYERDLHAGLDEGWFPQSGLRAPHAAEPA